MSCEGNRLKFFEQAQAVLKLDAAELEKIYQAGKAACVTPSEAELERMTEKTRLLFQDMQAVGLRPPTHSADGLPKITSRAGYAAVFDHLRRSAAAQVPNLQEYGLEEEERDLGNWPLPIELRHLLDDDGKNSAGVHFHRYVKKQSGGEAHIWFGAPRGEEGLNFKPINENEQAKTAEQIRDFVNAVDADGFLPDGYTPEGFDRDGFDPFGYSIYGLTREEMKDPKKIREAAASAHRLYYLRRERVSSKAYTADVEGYDSDGFRPYGLDEEQDCDRFGFNRLGFRGGRSWTGYDENGLDAQGKPAPQVKGYDAWGYERKTGLTAPDAQGRRFNLIGWVYDAAADECYDPQNPARRMKHSGSFGYSTKYKKVVLKRSYVPTPQEMEERVRNPSIRWNEYRSGGGQLLRYACLDWAGRMAAYKLNRPDIRYFRSRQYLNDHPNADFLGVPLRCPKCGQFTGAAPHLCPQYGGRRVLALTNGMVIGFERGAWKPVDYYAKHIRQYSKYGYKEGWFSDVYNDLLEIWKKKRWVFLKSDEAQTGDRTFYGLGVIDGVDALADFLWRKGDDETAVVLEAPHSPLGAAFDPDYDGGLLPGHHWRSGLSREGYDPYGFHYLSGATRQGVSRSSIKTSIRLKTMLKEAEDLLREKGRNAKDVLEATYSRIATAIAGAARRVTIAENGGPRPGMFWTDMRGRIQAERYPLKNTPQNSEINNLLAMKAGIYHELGHEEDTPVGIFARVLDIANGREEVEGIPRNAAGLVAEIYNILEDGRMERVQSKRRRGVASILAADALINPRWDEKVGEEIPLVHQVMGMMLYRSLPFFRVRQEVLDAASERARNLYAEVEPLVDRAMQSPQDTFLSCIEITRRLIQSDEQMRQFAEQITQNQSQGGKWVFEGGDGQGKPSLIISALPKPGGMVQPDRSLVIPPRGWGQQDEASRGGDRQSQQQDEASGGGGGQSQQQDQASGGGDRQSQQKDQASAGKSGRRVFVTPQIDENFFSGISSQVNMNLDEVVGDLAADLRQGINAILRSPVGKALQRPLSEVGDIVLEDPCDPQVNHTVQVLSSSNAKQTLIHKLKENAQSEGRKVARRLEVLKEEVRRKVRLQPTGALDRKRFKRALAGAETVYRQTRAHDITSLAVSIQLDMSGSMRSQIITGHLASATLALEEALQRLDAEYMVSGFGTDYALIKSFGDERIRDEQAAAMLDNELGGTTAAPAMRLGLLGLKETQSANKLHVVMTDGQFSDNEKAARQAEEMRRNGILPFGIFFGRNAPASDLNRVFGEGGWVKIEKLSDLSEVVARRIEQIYRKILATR